MISADDRPASITSVTHINSFSAAQTKAAAIRSGATPPSTLAPAALLARLGEGSQATSDISGFVRNPKLVREDVLVQQVELGLFRDTLDIPGRLAHATQLKEEANLHFAQGRWRVALVGRLPRTGPLVPTLSLIFRPPTHTQPTNAHPPSPAPPS